MHQRLALLSLILALSASALADDVPDLRTRKTGHDWPSFLGPTGDSKSAEKGVLTEWPAQGPRIVWQTKLGDPRAQGYAPPAISKGRIFVFDRVRNLNRLRCMKAETGEPIWNYTYTTDYVDLLNYDGGPRCAPVVDDDRVYIFGAEGQLHCVNVLDGKLIWKVDTEAQFGVIQNFFGVGACPVIEGDLLLCQVGGSPKEDDTPVNIYEAGGKVKANGSAIVAFDKRTGKVVYKTGDELASYATPTLATINGRRWCFAFMRGGLMGFDPKTGKVDFYYPWRAKLLESVNASSPVVIGNKVFISECYAVGSSLLEIKPDDKNKYEVVWSDERRPVMATHWNTAIHVNGYIYGSSGRHSNGATLRCIRASDGEVMWSQGQLSRSQLLYVDGHFVVLTEGGALLLIKAVPDRFAPVAAASPNTGKDSDGDGAFDRLLRYPAWAAPVLSNGLLYVRGKDRLLCMELIPQKKD